MESAQEAQMALHSVILQLSDWGFTSKSVGYVVPQPFAKRIKNLDP